MKAKEQIELVSYIGRRLREAADAGQSLPKDMQARLKVLRDTETRASSELSQEPYRGWPGRHSRAPK